tara:strand:- start:761 stop:973 length:213 start_codon:yes stop_codon:yes gene_type:complete
MEAEDKRYINTGEAKTLVNLMFDNKLFRNDLTRDDLNSIEEYLDYSLNSRLKTHVEFSDLFKKLKEKNNK